jgi:hypothetical protein
MYKALDLFGNNTYQVAEDIHEEPLLQIADVLANSIGRCFCLNQLDSNAAQIIDCLKKHICMEQFPYEKSLYFGKITGENEHDNKIAEIALIKALKFIEENDSLVEHIEVLKYLLLIFKTNPCRTVSTQELVNVVRRKGIKFSSQQLRTVIQDMRDKKVIIASLQGKYGYKIPNTKNDMIEFFNRYLNSVVPMLKRAKIANEQLQINSVNEINLLHSEDSFEILRNLIDQI